MKNFPLILYKQRKELMKLVSSLNGINESSTSNVESAEAGTECVLVGYLDADGNMLNPVTTVTSTASLVNNFHTKPCLSKSLVLDIGVEVESAATKSNKRTHDIDSVEPMPVYDILKNQGVEGQTIARSITETKWITPSQQTSMLRILTDHVFAQGGTYYPKTDVKIAMAKGIINDFPDLADEDKGFLTWYNPYKSRGIIQTKYQSLREKLPQEEKKNRKVNQGKNKSESSSSLSKKSKQVSTSTETSELNLSVGGSSLNLSPELQVELSETRNLVPTALNNQRIAMALRNTFVMRRRWILKDHPTCTDILNKFPHLGSFEGKMIAQEFQMQNPLANDLVETFKRWAPHILHYATKTKPAVVESLSNEFRDSPDKDNIVALLILPKLLPTVANPKTMENWELEHIKLYKLQLDALVSSSLVQIVPEGTNAKLYCSVEAPRQEAQRKRSIFPFLLWLTNDRKGGQIYVKIDQQTFYLGSSTKNPDLLLNGVDLTMKAYYAFNLHYHPYLKTSYTFLETLYNISKASNTTKFMNALRSISSTA